LKNILIFSIENGQLREPALCQLYRRIFVPFAVNRWRGPGHSAAVATTAKQLDAAVSTAKDRVADAICQISLIL